MWRKTGSAGHCQQFKSRSNRFWHCNRIYDYCISDSRLGSLYCFRTLCRSDWRLLAAFEVTPDASWNCRNYSFYWYGGKMPMLLYLPVLRGNRRRKTVQSAIKTGFAKALSAIVDGNVTTLIAAVVLYWRGSGTVGICHNTGLRYCAVHVYSIIYY